MRRAIWVGERFQRKTTGITENPRIIISMFTIIMITVILKRGVKDIIDICRGRA